MKINWIAVRHPMACDLMEARQVNSFRAHHIRDIPINFPIVQLFCNSGRRTKVGQLNAGATMHSGKTTQFTAGDPVDLIELDGRILVDGVDVRCRVPWVRGRAVRVSIVQPTTFVPGERVILYLDLIGRVEGTASPVGSTELDVAIVTPLAKWERLRRQFATIAAMAAEDRVNMRGYHRVVPDRPDVRLIAADGVETASQVCDVSRSGAAVSSSVMPEIGSIVTLGTTRGRVVRPLEGGFAVQFLRLLPLESFGAAYVL